MVSSGVVNGDLSTVISSLSEYDSIISGLDGSWKGTSHDSITSKASEFTGSFKGAIQSGMTAFASACDLYEQYKSTKDSLEAAKKSYNSLVSSGDKDDSSYATRLNELQTQINNLTSKLQSLKSQIISQLSTAASQQLEATSNSTGAKAGAGLGSSKNIDFSKEENFQYYNQGGGQWNDYGYKNGGASTMGSSGCGPTSMAMVAASLGYDVTPNDTAAWSTEHGFHGNGTLEGYFTAYADEMGMDCNVLGYSGDNIKNALSNNELVILHVGPGSYGDFTSTGHYIVARAYDEETNQVLIADPNKTSNNRWHDLDRVVNQLKGGDASWSFSVN